MLPGRVNTFRVAGSKLLFLDLSQQGRRVQGVCNFGKMESHVDLQNLKELTRSLQRGDIYSEAQQRQAQYHRSFLHCHRHQRHAA